MRASYINWILFHFPARKRRQTVKAARAHLQLGSELWDTSEKICAYVWSETTETSAARYIYHSLLADSPFDHQTWSPGLRPVPFRPVPCRRHVSSNVLSQLRSYVHYTSLERIPPDHTLKVALGRGLVAVEHVIIESRICLCEYLGPSKLHRSRSLHATLNCPAYVLNDTLAYVCTSTYGAVL